MTWHEDPTTLQVIEQVSRELVRRNQHLVEYEDTRQELMLWAHEHSRAISKARSEDFYEGWLRTGLRNAGRDYIASIQKQTGGNHYDQSHYTRKQIKALIPSVFDQNLRIEPPVEQHTGGGRSTTDPATGGNYLVQCIDVAAAYEALPESYQTLVKAAWYERVSQSELARAQGKAQSTVAYHLDRALDAMYAYLGGTVTLDRMDSEDEEVIGQRRAMSNSAARAMLHMQYEGDNT